jgi:hypothetical protein
VNCCPDFPGDARRWGRSLRRLTLASVVLLAAPAGGCRAQPQLGDYVAVTIKVPVNVRYDGVRVAKFVGDSVERPTDTPVADGAAPFLAVRRPEVGIAVRMFVQATNADQIVAQGEAPIDPTAGRDIVLELAACLPPMLRKAELTSCGVNEPIDAGVDRPSTGLGKQVRTADDGGDVAATPEAPPDAGEPADGGGWEAPVCQHPDLQASNPLPPAQPSPGCVHYCDVIEANCKGVVYEDIAHCQYACFALDWPEQGATRNSLQCRTLWAGDAAGLPDEERQVECKRAAPNPGPACSSNVCDIYCSMGTQICGSYFPPLIDCLRDCLHADHVFEMSGSDLGGVLACRMDWLGKAIFNRELCSWSAPYNMCGIEDPHCPNIFFDRVAAPGSASSALSATSPPSPGGSLR